MFCAYHFTDLASRDKVESSEMKCAQSVFVVAWITNTSIVLNACDGKLRVTTHPTPTGLEPATPRFEV